MDSASTNSSLKYIDNLIRSCLSTKSTGLFVIEIPRSFCPTTLALEINFKYFPTVVVDFPSFKRSSLNFASLTAVSVFKVLELIGNLHSKFTSYFNSFGLRETLTALSK